MKFEKTVQVVMVKSRTVSKDGKDNIFYDLQFVVPGEGIGELGIPQGMAVLAGQLVGQEAVLFIETEQDSRTKWLHRLNVRDLQASAGKVSRSA